MSNSNSLPAPIIPVHVVTGFLGSGKTTLLNRLLAQPAFAESALVVSEFGEVGLDQALVQMPGSRVVLLDNGCVCCAAADDLLQTLADLLSRRRCGELRFARIMVECSGVSQTLPVLQSVLLLASRGLRLGWVLAAVDAVHGEVTLEQEPVAAEQAALADVLLLTKTDLVFHERAQALVQRLAAAHPQARVLPAALGEMDLAWLADLEQPRARAATGILLENPGRGMRPSRSQAHAGISSLVLKVEAPLRWASFADWLQRLLSHDGDALLRVKAILQLQDVDVPVALHAVRDRIYPPERLAGWDGRPPLSRIVFIARDLDLLAVREGFAAQVAAPLPAQSPA